MDAACFSLPSRLQYGLPPRLLVAFLLLLRWTPVCVFAVSPTVASVLTETDEVTSMIIICVSHQRIPPVLPSDCPPYISSLRVYSEPDFPAMLLNHTSPEDLEPIATVLSFVSSFYNIPPLLATIRLGAAISTRAVSDAESLAAYKNAVDHARALRLLTALHQNFSECFGVDPWLLTPVPFARNWTFSPAAQPQYAFDVVVNGTQATLDFSAWAAEFAAAAGATSASCIVIDAASDETGGGKTNSTARLRVRFVGPDALVLQTNALQFSQLLNAPVLARLGVLEFRAVLIRSPAPPASPDGLSKGVLFLPLIVLVPLMIWGVHRSYRYVCEKRAKKEALELELREILLLPDDD